MKTSLWLEWQMNRWGRSTAMALVGSAALAITWGCLINGNRYKQGEIELLKGRSAYAEHADAERRAEVNSWRSRLQTEQERLPQLRQAPLIVSKAVSAIESAGVGFEGVTTTSQRVANAPFHVVTVDARLSGTAAKASAAISKAMAESPGWAVERVALERRPAGMVTAEVTFSLLVRDD